MRDSNQIQRPLSVERDGAGGGLVAVRQSPSQKIVAAPCCESAPRLRDWYLFTRSGSLETTGSATASANARRRLAATAAPLRSTMALIQVHRSTNPERTPTEGRAWTRIQQRAMARLSLRSRAWE